MDLRDGRGPVARGPSPDSATNLSSEEGHVLFVTSYLRLSCSTFTPTEACGNSRQTLRLSSNVCSSVIKIQGAHHIPNTGSTRPHTRVDTPSLRAVRGGSGPRSGEGLVLLPVTCWCHQRFRGRLRTEKEKPYLDCVVSPLISTSWESAAPGSIWRLARCGHFEFSAAAVPTVSLLSFSEQSRVSSQLRHTPPAAGARSPRPGASAGLATALPPGKPRRAAPRPADTRCPGVLASPSRCGWELQTQER